MKGRLKMKSSWVAICVLSYSVLPNFLHAEIYKWTDENGKIHYSDKPMSDQAQTVKIDDNLSQTQVQDAKQQAEKLIDLQNRLVTDKLKSEATAKKEQEKQQQQEKQQKMACIEAKEGLRILNSQRPIYNMNENSERVYLEDEQRTAEINKLNDLIETHCE